jgi:hypothetical protein
MRRVKNYFAAFAILKRAIAAKFSLLNKILGNANMLSQKDWFFSTLFIL